MAADIPTRVAATKPLAPPYLRSDAVQNRTMQAWAFEGPDGPLLANPGDWVIMVPRVVPGPAIQIAKGL